MRIFTLSKALAVVLLLAPMLAHAAGLGRLTVQSSLGQPLSAEIDLVAVRGDEASSLEARLASPDAYQKANLQYNSSIAGIKLSIEKRAGGQSYLKLTGSRPVSEPFVDLLIELTWSGGRLMREYTALLDPPGYGQQAQVAAAPSAPVPVPETRPIAAPAAVPAPAPAPAPAAPVAATAQEYGPIAKGETLSQIAAGLKPEGVSLEQMLLGLFRSNPDAFIRNNMNLVKAGKILRVPDAQTLAAITQGEAVKEYRTQVSDWRAYVARVAETAGTATAEGSSTVRGRITTQDGAGAAAGDKDVVKLSKGEPGKGGTSAARAQALQEELVARNKELAEANDRISQLEKTIKDTQKLAELKSPGLAAAQKKAEASKDAKKTETAKPAAKPEPAPKAEMKGADVAPPAEAKKDGEAMTPPAEKPVAETKPVPKPKPKPKVVAPPPPPPEPSVMDMVMENLPVVGGGILALVLGGAGFAALRRRRARMQDDAGDVEPVVAPTMSSDVDVGAEDEAAAAPAGEAAAGGDEVDPVAEAEVYIAYGRDGQAEEILKEAMSRDPAREDVQVKLAEVYAARKDAAAFGTIAKSMQTLTAGAGDNWIKIAALGYALDPENPMYEAGKDVAPPVDSGNDAAVGTDLDFDLGGDTSGTPDIALDADPAAGEATEIGGTADMAAAADAGVEPGAEPDFNLDAPAAAIETDIALDAPTQADAPAMDFNIELPAVDAPAAEPAAAEAAAPAADAGLDFKIDVGDLNINLDDTSTTAAPAEGKDSHWYDVQQKFDLAKAYQEMGDNDGAKEILQEVIKEGDAEQQEQAQKLLSTLG